MIIAKKDDRVKGQPSKARVSVYQDATAISSLCFSYTRQSAQSLSPVLESSSARRQQTSYHYSEPLLLRQPTFS
ncbi:hypothetical protein BDZ89DRAFT_1073077 [Hymenopellis radicata]|nr:hypothetical protein BDZ89DRAFT_1073077 [Hymenopellis radicata]